MSAVVEGGGEGRILTIKDSSSMLLSLGSVDGGCATSELLILNSLSILVVVVNVSVSL